MPGVPAESVIEPGLHPGDPFTAVPVGVLCEPDGKYAVACVNQNRVAVIDLPRSSSRAPSRPARADGIASSTTAALQQPGRGHHAALVSVPPTPRRGRALVDFTPCRFSSPPFSRRCLGAVAFVEELPGANTQGGIWLRNRANLREAVELTLEANRALAEEDLKGQDVIRETLKLPAA
jgi:hypothetical protein